MEEQPPLSLADIASDDWNSTPEPVKQLVEALLVRVKQDDVLLEEQSRLTQFLNATPIGIAVHDSTGQLAYVNHVGQELLGFDRRSAPQATLLPEIFQVYRTSSQELYPVEELPSNLALAGKTVQVDDLEIHRANQVMPLEVWATPIFDDRGQVEYAIATFQDITERRNSEAERYKIGQALAASEHRYRQVVQTQSDFILRSLPDTTITFANDALCRALGQSLEQVIGQQWCDFAYGEDIPIILQQIAALTPDHSGFIAENRDRRADDQVGWTQWLNQGIFDEQGHLVELQSVGRDITALKHTEAALRESEAELKLITETIPAAIIRVDKDQRYRFVNSTYEAWLNLKREDILGKRVQDVIGERAYETICSDLDRVLDGEIVKRETRVEQWSGMIREITYTLVPERDQLAQVQGYYALITDITDRRQTEVALRESEERFRLFMDHSPAAAWITDQDGRMEYVSQTYSRMFQVASNLIGKTVVDLYPSAIAQVYLDNIQTVAHSGQVIEAIEPGIRADGSPGEFLIYKFLLPQADDRRLVGGVALDVTERKQVERALQVSEERYRQVVETTLEGVWIIDNANRTTYVNPRMAEMLGYTTDDMIGKELFHFMDEEGKAIANRNLQRRKQGIEEQHDFQFKTKTGQDLWVLISTNPLHDDAGTYIGALGMITDITDRKQAQIALERSEQRFRNLFESIPKIAIQGYNRHRQVIYWNDASEQLYGYSKTEALGQQLEDLIIPPEMRPAVITAVHNWLTKNEPIPASELSLMRQDGSRVAVYSSHTMLTNPDDEPEMYCVDIDLSDRNQAEAALRKSETTNRAILNAFPDLLLRVQHDGTCHDFMPPTDALSSTFLPIQHHLAEVLPPDLLQHFLQRIAHSLATGELQVWEHQILKYDCLCDEEIRLVPCGTDECLVVVRDITDRKRAETLLNQREQEFRTLAENAPDIIIRSDRDLRYRYVNPAVTVATGLLPQDFIGKTGYEVGLPTAYVALWDTAFTRTFTTAVRQYLEFPFPAPDGMKEYQVRFVPEFAADGGVVSVLAIAHDVTEQKQLEQALRQRVDQEQTLRRVLQAIRKSLSLDLIFRTATAEVAELVQADRTAVVQYLPERQCWKHVSEYRKSLDIPDTLGVEIPDQDNPLAEQLKQFKVVRIGNLEVIKDEINQEFAKTFPGSWLLVPLIVDQKLWGSFSMVRSHQVCPWTDEQANLVLTVADQVAIAIQQAQAFELAQTEIAERQQAEADLRSALSEKEVLLKEIHHRVKNNLQIVSGLLQLQAQSLQDSPAVHALRESQNRVESMSLIHKKLYISSDLEQIDAADYIQSLATSLLTTYKVSPGAIALQVDVEPVILSLDQGIPCGLIINELVSNALKYAFPANHLGEIRIRLRQINHELELIIQDNGIGLPDHLDVTNTSSLGLSLVYALSTEQLEGSLAVDHSQGTTFKIRFPQSAS